MQIYVDMNLFSGPKHRCCIQQSLRAKKGYLYKELYWPEMLWQYMYIQQCSSVLFTGMLILGCVLRNVPGVNIVGENLDSRWSSALR